MRGGRSRRHRAGGGSGAGAGGLSRSLVLERAYTIGFETSSRNSEVIHGGLYYPPGSLKARSCVEGRHRLYAYCREHGVPHARIGKLIVATSEAEIAGLEKIAATARGNGVDDLEWLDPDAGPAARAGAATASRPCCRRRPASSTATR